MITLLYSSVQVSHDSVTVSQHVQYQDFEIEAAKRNLAIINFIVYICAFPTSMKKVGWIYRILIRLFISIPNYY